MIHEWSLDHGTPEGVIRKGNRFKAFVHSRDMVNKK
jgi:hypothetical protein